jgi:hypothetical protein
VSAHGPREEFIEAAWQELATELSLTGKHCGWFKQWFDQKIISVCGKLVAVEMDAHIKTQDEAAQLKETLKAANLDLSKAVAALGEATAKINRARAEA